MTQNRVNTPAVFRQFVSATSATVTDATTVIPTDTSIPQNTEGDEIITLSITPTSATSTLEITASLAAHTSASRFTMALFQDSTADALQSTLSRASQKSCVMRHVMTSGTATSTTFKIRVGANVSGNTYVNGDSSGVRLMGGVSYVNFVIKEYL